VVDLDVKNQSPEAVELGRRIVGKLPKTRVDKTPSGGEHFVFYSKKPVKSDARFLAKCGLEILGEGKLCVMAPSQGYGIMDHPGYATVENLNALLYRLMHAEGVIDSEQEAGADETVLETWLEQVKPRLSVEEEDDSRIYVHCPFHPPDEHPSFAIVKKKFYAVDYHDGKVYNLKELAQALKVPLKTPRLEKELEKEETGGEKRRVERIVFKDLGSSLLQEVYDGQSFRFILFDQATGEWKLVDEHEDPGLQVVYRPTNIPVSKIGLPRVILPAEPEEYGDGKKLLDDVAWFIKKYDELSDDDLWLATRFVLHSWIYDVGDYAMQLLVLGMFGSGKTRLFKTLRLVCYNALGLAGGSSLSAYRRLQERFRGTLLVNEFEPDKSMNASEDSNEIIQWLNNGFERDLPIALSNKKDPSKQEFFDPFCPKLLTSRNMIENVATRSRLVIIKMQQKTREDIPIHLPKEAYEEAATLRNRLLSFRLKHWRQNYELPSEIDAKLRGASDIDDRFKQVMMPMLLLYSITGLDVEEVFNFYRKQQALFKRDIALGTTEGIVFNALVETARQESFEDPEFYGWIDEDRKLVGVGSSLLKERTGFSTRTITKALERIGLKLERASFKVLDWNKRLNEPETRVKTLRLWRFPDEKTWRRAFKLYAYEGEDKGKKPTESQGLVPTSTMEPECPPALRSSAFILCDACDACDAYRNRVPERNEEREGEGVPIEEGQQQTYPVPTGVTSVTSVTEPEQSNPPVYGAEGQPCKFCGRLGGVARLRNGEFFYAHDKCLKENSEN